MKDVFCFSELLNTARLQVKTHQGLKETGLDISLFRKLLALNKLHSLFTAVFNGTSKERVYSNKTPPQLGKIHTC